MIYKLTNEHDMRKPAKYTNFTGDPRIQSSTSEKYFLHFVHILSYSIKNHNFLLLVYGYINYDIIKNSFHKRTIISA